MTAQIHQDQTINIALIGDIHDQWSAADNEALIQLGFDLALFVGDFGNESVDVVRQIADLAIPKAAIMGNHDAWYSASDWGRSKCPYDRRLEDRVQAQLDLLGEAQVGYSKLDVADLKLSVVGGRPFSWGGSAWKNGQFYQERYGISGFEESIEQIMQSMQQAAYETVLMIGHCGPTGLGDTAEAPCGKDWNPIGGDYGDPDLAVAIAQARELGKTIPLVTFGHMHHRLRHRKDQLRQMVAVDKANTVYVNCASVPRVIETKQGVLRNFSQVTLRGQQVIKATLIWVNSKYQVVSEEVLYEAETAIAH